MGEGWGYFGPPLPVSFCDRWWVGRFCISNIDGRCFSIFGFGGVAAVCQTDCQCKVPEEENTLLGEGEEEGSKRSVDTGWEGAIHILDDKR